MFYCKLGNFWVAKQLIACRNLFSSMGIVWWQDNTNMNLGRNGIRGCRLDSYGSGYGPVANSRELRSTSNCYRRALRTGVGHGHKYRGSLSPPISNEWRRIISAVRVRAREHLVVRPGPRNIKHVYRNANFRTCHSFIKVCWSSRAMYTYTASSFKVEGYEGQATSRTVPRNIGRSVPDYTASRLRRQYWYSPPHDSKSNNL
jgi:hypothetical protein